MTPVAPKEATQTLQPQTLSRTPGLLTDKKLLRNALCTEWPNYFLGNKNTVVVNHSGQVSLVRDA